MGNISNLATTGNYKNEVNGLEVSFTFKVDNESKKLIEYSGYIREVTNEPNDRPVEEKNLATFNKSMRHDVVNGMTMSLTRGREIELATIIVDAVTGLESQIKAGEMATYPQE